MSFRARAEGNKMIGRSAPIADHVIVSKVPWEHSVSADLPSLSSLFSYSTPSEYPRQMITRAST
jgi:hypothetical protein